MENFVCAVLKKRFKCWFFFVIKLMKRQQGRDWRETAADFTAANANVANHRLMTKFCCCCQRRCPVESCSDNSSTRRSCCLLLLIACLHNEHVINAHTRNSRSSHTHTWLRTGKFDFPRCVTTFAFPFTSLLPRARSSQLHGNKGKAPLRKVPDPVLSYLNGAQCNTCSRVRLHL